MVHPKKLASVNINKKYRNKNKNKNKLQTKLVTNKNTENKLDAIISKALNENSISRDLKETIFVNPNRDDKLDFKDGTPVTISSVYHPNNTKKTLADNLLVLIDCGSSHIMVKASIVKKSKDDFFRKNILL